MNLHDYQLTALDATAMGWRNYQRQLGVAATGAGKTVIMANVAKACQGPVLFLAHRRELIAQAMATFDRWQAREWAFPNHHHNPEKVTFSTIQAARMNVNLPEPELILCDEAHHATADEWQEVLARWPRARILGVTATPSRTDALALGDFFQHIPFEIGLLQLIGDGKLAQIRAKKLEITANIRRLTQSRGEVTVEENANAISPLIAELAKAVAGEIRDRKAIVFLPRCDVSQAFADALARNGVASFHADGSDRQSVSAFRAAGKNSALCNAQLLTEGFDCPEIDCVVILRATKSKAMYSQMVGRGTRLSPGKVDCLVLDPLWICGEIDICEPADIFAKTKEHRHILQAQLDSGLPVTEAEEITQREVEKALAKRLEEAKKNAKAPRGTVDPIAYAVGIHDSDLAEYEPAMPWEMEPPTSDQTARLTALGFFQLRVTRGFAVKLIERLEKREKLGLATPKQVDVLRRFKVPNAETVTKAQASHLMQRLLRR